MKSAPAIYYVYETAKDGSEQCVYGPVERKLAHHVAKKGNKLRRDGAHHPYYDVRVAT